MATGDNERTALAVTGRLGIDEVRVALLPKAQKDLIDRLRRDGHKITMAGDEGNDAPALAAADAIRALRSDRLAQSSRQTFSNYLTPSGHKRRMLTITGKSSNSNLDCRDPIHQGSGQPSWNRSQRNFKPSGTSVRPPTSSEMAIMPCGSAVANSSPR